MTHCKRCGLRLIDGWCPCLPPKDVDEEFTPPAADDGADDHVDPDDTDICEP